MPEPPLPVSDASAEPPRPRRERWCALVLVAVASAGLGLRLYNIDFGLPYPLHPDEPAKLYAVGRMVRERTVDPGYYRHPALLIDGVAAAGAIAHFVAGLPAERQTAHLAGRVLVAIFGTLTILVAGTLAGELADAVGDSGAARREASSGRVRWAGVAAATAAAFTAIAPLHVVTSHYIKEDVPLALFLSLTVLFAIRTARADDRRDLIAAVACAALALSTKYSGALAVPIVLLALTLRWLRSCRGKRALLSPPRVLIAAVGLVALAAAIFLLFNPGAVANPGGFLHDLRFEQRHGLGGGHAFTISPWRHLWTFHLFHSLLPGLTAPLLVAALAGLALVAVRGGAAGGVLVASVAVWYLAHEASPLKPPPNFDRYVAPLVPLLAAAAGVAIAVLPRLLVRGLAQAGSVVRATVPLALVLVVGGAALYRSMIILGDMEPDTRLTARDWLIAHVAPGDVVVSDLYGPALRDADWRSEYVETRALGRASQPEGGWDPATGRLTIRRGGGLEVVVADWVVTSSFQRDRYFSNDADDNPERAAARRAYLRLEDAWGAPVVRFGPVHRSYGFHNPHLAVYRRPASLPRP